MKIATWNVNSVNARIEHLKKFIEIKQPDIILLQELKCQKEKFPFDALDEYNYNIEIYGQKSYNGVAILSKSPLEDVVVGIPELNNELDTEARYIEAFTVINNVPLRVSSVYVPNGSAIGSEKFLYKLHFLEKLKSHLAGLYKKEENIIIAGDLNIAPEELDVYNPKALDGHIGFHIQERSMLRSILNSGFTDTFRALNPDLQEFSWWDYRSGGYSQNKGMRIDHILASAEISDMISNIEIFKDTRVWSKPSDHAPVICYMR